MANKLLKRNEKQEIVKYRVRKTFATLNPFGTVMGRAFKIELEEEVIKNIESIINEKKVDKTFTSSDVKNIYKVMNKSDTRDFMTIYIQELLKENNFKIKDNVAILSAVKLASVASLLPVRYNGAKKALAIIVKKLEELAIQQAKLVSTKFGDKLEALLEDKNKFDKKQSIIPHDVDSLRSYYWNKFEQVALLIQSEIKETYKISEDEANAIPLISKYQPLFNEYNASINDKKSTNITEMISFAELSAIMVEYFKEIKEITERRKMKFGSSLLTHLTETSEKVNLSDMPKLTITQVLSLAVSYLLLMAWSAVILFPLIQMLTLSFDGKKVNRLGETGGTDLGTFVHYKKLWENTDFKYWLNNSLLVAFVTMVLTVTMTVLLAYAFSRFKFRGKKSSIMTIMLLQMVPSIAALTAFLVLFQLAQSGLKIGVLPFLIVIYTGGALTGNTFILKGYFDSIPRDLDEASELDGASKMRTFRSILIPLAKPMIAIVALWSFIGPFGDVILPNLLNDHSAEASKKLTMAAGLKTLITNTSTGGNVYQLEYLAGAIVTSVPIAAMFMTTQKFLVGGLTAGAVK